MKSAITVLAVVATMGAAGGVAHAQTAGRVGPGLGAMAAWTLNGDRNTKGTGSSADFAVSADVVLSPGWRVRADFGRARWTFDGSEGLPAPLPKEHISLTRVTGSVLRDISDLAGGAYIGGGLGVYRYGSEVSPLPRATRPGGHVLAGIEGELGGGLSLAFEGQLQVVGGPNAAGGPGLIRFDTGGGEERSRVFSTVLFNLLAGAGIRWRF